MKDLCYHGQTMGPLIRPARPDELEEMARAIARTMVGETRHVDDLGVFVQIGPRRGLGMHRRCLLDGFQHTAMRMLRDSDQVGVLEVEGEPLGWAAYASPSQDRPLTIRFVFVDPLVRSRGFGRMLLTWALAARDAREPRLSCITPGGATLFKAVAALTHEVDSAAASQPDR